MIIRTPRDWWNAVNQNWEYILDIFENAGAPMGRSEDDHWWSDGIGQDITRHERPLVQVLENAKIDRDHETLHHYFNLAWLAAPDQPSIHQWVAWDVFCDLCSENWVFDPEQI